MLWQPMDSVRRPCRAPPPLGVQDHREMVASARQRHAALIRRRAHLLVHRRNQARYALARARASHPLRPMLTPFEWLADVVAGQADPRKRAAWRLLHARFQVRRVPRDPVALGLRSGSSLAVVQRRNARGPGCRVGWSPPGSGSCSATTRFPSCH